MILLVLAAIAVSTAAGVATERRLGPQATDRLNRRILDALLWVFLPPITFVLIARLHVTAGVGAGLVAAYVVQLSCGVLAARIGLRLLRTPRPTAGGMATGVFMANTGYLGIPLTATLLGHDALGAAVAYDAIVSGPMFYVFGFAVGAAFGTRTAQASRGERARTFLRRNPPLVAVLLGLSAPDVLAPDALVSAARAAAYVLLPVGFFVLGVNLTQESADGALRLPPPVTRPVATVVALRLGLAPALLLGAGGIAAAGGHPFPDAYFVQAAMPCGINNLVVAHAYGLDLPLSAAAVAWSTVLAVGVATLAALLS